MWLTDTSGSLKPSDCGGSTCSRIPMPRRWARCRSGGGASTHEDEWRRRRATAAAGAGRGGGDLLYKKLGFLRGLAFREEKKQLGGDIYSDTRLSPALRWRGGIRIRRRKWQWKDIFLDFFRLRRRYPPRRRSRSGSKPECPGRGGGGKGRHRAPCTQVINHNVYDMCNHNATCCRGKRTCRCL